MGSADAFADPMGDVPRSCRLCGSREERGVHDLLRQIPGQRHREMVLLFRGFAHMLSSSFLSGRFLLFASYNPSLAAQTHRHERYASGTKHPRAQVAYRAHAYNRDHHLCCRVDAALLRTATHTFRFPVSQRDCFLPRVRYASGAIDRVRHHVCQPVCLLLLQRALSGGHSVVTALQASQ